MIGFYVGAIGDNDPIDAIEVGTMKSPLPMGSVVRAKVLGSLALIDEGATDHKVIVIREDDPLFDKIHNLRDLNRQNEGVIDRLKDWLKNYKTSDGKPQNVLANNEVPRNPQETGTIIAEVAEFYEGLVSGNTVVEDAFYLPRSVSKKPAASSGKTSAGSHTKTIQTDAPATDDVY